MIPDEVLRELVADVADRTLFAHALEVDERIAIPSGHFEALASAGLYGLGGPPDAGGKGLDARAQRRVLETLAGGCLSTALVWAQHEGVVRRLTRAQPSQVRDVLLPELCAGRLRGGLALAGLLPGKPMLQLEPIGDGVYELRGRAPAVSGWTYVELLLVVARSGPEEVSYVLLDAAAEGLRPRPRRLAALNATRTVELNFLGVRVPRQGIVHTEPIPEWGAIGDGVRSNGSHALGIAGRCARILSDARIVADVDRCRTALDDAGDGDPLAAARADAALLALRTASQLVVERGSRALDMREHAQRLMREAMFVLAFAQRPAIKDALRDGLVRFP